MSVTLTTDAHSFMLKQINDLGSEVRELKKQNRGLTILKQEAESRSFCYEAENKELKKVSSAKSDTILNMLYLITHDPDEDDKTYGFTLSRLWGEKYNDEWNKIVTDELKDAVKEINEDLDGELEWKTDGYSFSVQFKEGVLSSDTEEEVEEKRVCLVGVCKGMTWEDAKSFIIEKHSEEYWRGWIHRVNWGVVEEEYVPQGSKVDMEAFKKLKEGGMMPWVK